MNDKHKKEIEKYISYAVDSLIDGIEKIIRETIRQELAKIKYPEPIIQETTNIVNETYIKPEFLTTKELCVRLNISQSTLWRLSKSPNFPKRIQIGPNSVRWKALEIDAWEKTLSVAKHYSKNVDKANKARKKV